MNTPPQPGSSQHQSAPSEQRLAFSALPVKELLKRLPLLYATLHATLEQVEAIVDALGNYAVFAERNEDQYATLVNGVEEALVLLQAVTAGEGLSPAWLTRRDELVIWLRARIDDQHITQPSSKEGTTPL